MVKDGWGQSSYGTLNLTASQELTDGINGLFACWYKFAKAKSYFNYFWFGMVKNGYSHLVQVTLKSAVS